MANYAAQIYTSPGALETAIEAIADTSTFAVIPYREGCSPRFMLITPAPNKAT
jgi:hypothetical protein